MPERNVNFPFVAVSGMEAAKKALMCSIVNPRIRTVLIRGTRGTAKTVLSRAAYDISGKDIVNIPVNVSEEQLFGGLDVDVAINEGRIAISKGLLSLKDHILYVDDIGHMDQGTAISLLDSVREGIVRLEREGVSAEYDCDLKLIATMDPDEADISSHLLDRFDLCAYSVTEKDDRRTILESNVEYFDDPRGFVDSLRDDTGKVRDNVERSKEILPLVTISEELMELCVDLCAHIGAHGFRGDISMVETSMTLAALDGRDRVTKDDVENAAKLCLIHRRDYSAPPPPQPPEEPPQDDDNPEKEEPDEPEKDDEDDDDGKDDADRPEMHEDFSDMLQDLMFEIGEEFRVIDYLKGQPKAIRRSSSRKGRREMAISNDMSGRYVRATVPQGRIRDVAFDATIRAAAPYQRIREDNGLAFRIRTQDVRTKVRERRSGCTILFLVDASGSLGVRKRMSAVKGAVMSMLKDSYVRRDRIGLMMFRRDSAELVLPPTRSVEYSFKLLEDLPTGGRTPLSQALAKVSDYMGSYARSHKGERCHVVLITDGHANVPLSNGANATEEARRLASDIHVPDLGWVVIDASARYSIMDEAERLAAELGAVYLRLESLDADRLAENVRSVIR